MDAIVSTVIGVVVALAVVVGLFTLGNLAVNRLSQRADDRVRPWLFAGPAALVLFIGLVVPAVRTVLLSFRGGKRGEEGFTLDNYENTLVDNDDVLSFDRLGDVFTSRLFLAGVLLLVIGVVVARASARKAIGTGGGLDFSSPVASLSLVVAVIVVLLAVFSTLRGVVWNNLWWVAAVTGLATLFGLALAVLADRSKNETAAKTMIFMPMAISMVGAAIIWKYVYDAPGPGQAPGLLNAVIRGLGFEPTNFFLGSQPWNNFWIMVIMIWIQTGFAMVVISAAIKGVPAELPEAARVDGANEVQVFWRVTLPQIAPTILVVVTTLMVTVMKVFDLVKATTNGAADTDVLANRMYEGLRNGNFTLSSTFAVMIFVLVLPVMWFNVHRNREEVRA